MMEAISRDAVLNEFCHSCDGWSCNPNTCCKTEWIRKLPPIQPDIMYIILETLYECGIYGEEATVKLIGTLKRLGRDDLLPPCAR